MCTRNAWASAWGVEGAHIYVEKWNEWGTLDWQAPSNSKILCQGEIWGNFSKVKFGALVELLPRPSWHWGLGLEESLGSPK